MQDWFRKLGRMRGAVMLPLLGAVALAGGGLGYVTTMPGESFQGPLPPLAAEQQALAQRLCEHGDHDH